MLANFLFSLTVTLPIIFVMSLGYWLRQKRIIDEQFVMVGSRLVFNVALPSLLFLKIAQAPIGEAFNALLIGYAAASILAIVILMRVFAALMKFDGSKSSVFIQGAYRGNMGIVGLAFVLNAYDASIIAEAAVYLGAMTLLYNLIAVALLQPADQLFSIKTIKALITNPLIISITLGVIWSAANIPMFTMLEQTGVYFANLSLPLALLCVGGSLGLASLKQNTKVVVWASVLKLCIIPLLILVGAILLGIRDQSLAIIYLMMSAPTAATSFVMAKQMTNHGELAGEIVVVTTIFASLTVTIGLFALKQLTFI